MLEIVFSDSAGGSLKVAQHYGEGEYCGGVVGIIIDRSDEYKPTKAEIETAQNNLEEKERRVWEKAIPLGGNAEDVFSFHLAWSVGSITENSVGIERLSAIEKLFSIYPENIGKSAAKEVHQSAIKNLAIIRSRVESGETLRIWYSNQPDEMCGLYWFISLINSWKCDLLKVVLIELPKWGINEDVTVEYSGWSDVAPEKWHDFLELQKDAPEVLLHTIAAQWSNLQKENTNLRAVINNKLQSVPENFYDHFILYELAKEKDEFNEANLIGRILGKYQLGVGDAWLALRIEEMIRADKLEISSHSPTDEPIYHRKLKKK